MNLTRLMSPLFLIGLILSGFWYMGSALTGLLLVIAAVLGFRSIFTRHVWQTSPLSKLMLVYLAWLFVVAFISTVSNTSMMSLAILAGLPVMYLVASNTPSLAEIWKSLRTLLFITGVGLATWAIWQVIRHVGDGQAVGPLTDRNAFAALMNLLWFPAAYLLLTSKSTSSRWVPLLLGGGLFLMSTALFATTSRGGGAVWLLLLPFMLWAGYRHTQSKSLVAMIPLIAILAYFCSALLLHTSMADRTFQLAQDPSTNARLLMWQSTIKMALAHPLIGTGWGTFASYYPAYRSPLENTSSGSFAHNDYLQLAAEGGITALLLQLGVMLGLLLQLKYSLKRTSDAAGLESVALLLGALAVFVHAGVNFIFCFAFINILVGLYLARAAQLTGTLRVIMVPRFEQIGRPVKRLLAGFVILLITAPFGLHLIAQACLVGGQPGLKVINLVMPNTSAYNIARLITAISPQESIAQEIMLQASEHALADSAGISAVGVNFQGELLNEALERLDLVRAGNANSPNIGVREVKLLMAYHTIFDGNVGGSGAAYAKAHQILRDNLKVDPYHANSMIALSRLQVAEGHRVDALYTLQLSKSRVLSRRDYQLIDLEGLRQIAAPRVIAELDNIEKQLRQIGSASETGQPLILPVNFSEHIDERLHAIAGQIQ